MSLPTLSIPTFKTKIPSNGTEIEYRPFLVREEKILLMALEGNSMNEITAATKRILNDCILSEVDIEKLATFDVEYLFLQLRGKSVGEIIEMVVGHTGDKAECTHKTEVSINIDDIKIEGITEDRKIQLDDRIGIVVRYPSMEDVSGTNDVEDPFNIIASCIEMVYDEENVYDEFSHEEMVQWLEGLNKNQFEKVASFFAEMPKLSYELEWTCPQCGQKDSFVVEGLHSFFTSG